jgi:hypothetical protein
MTGVLYFEIFFKKLYLLYIETEGLSTNEKWISHATMRHDLWTLAAKYAVNHLKILNP